MSRRVRPLTGADIESLGPIWGEVDWFVTDPVTRRRLDDAAMFDVKHRWFDSVTRAWGTPGLVLPGAEPGRVAGYALFAPPGLVPGGDVPPTAPVSSDALVLLEVRGASSGLDELVAKMLVQAVVAEMARRGSGEALEAFVERGPGALLTRPLLESIGFHVKRDHPSVPRMRLELRGTRRWITDVEERWERLLEGVRGHKEPATGKPAAGPVRSLPEGS